MFRTRTQTLITLFTVCFLALASAHAQGDKIKVKGLITGRTGETIMQNAGSVECGSPSPHSPPRNCHDRQVLALHQSHESSATLTLGLTVIRAQPGEMTL
jgi:hypothetical protein